jgi:hypothetical protein
MRRRGVFAFVVPLVLLTASSASARKWTDSTGKFTIAADLIAADDKRAVLQTPEHRLVSIDLERLSKPDQEFIQAELKKPTASSSPEVDQIWTMRSGLKVRARVVGYGERNMTVLSRGGNVFVNDRRYDNLPEVYQKMVPKIVGHFEQTEFPTENDFKAWAAKSARTQREFACSGVILELDNGDRYSVPFFFFSEEDLKVLQPGWQRWLAAKQGSMDREREDFLVEAQARAYQQDRANKDQVANLQLGLLSTIAGLTSIWQVELYPGQGVQGRPMWVVVPARDSRQATVTALNEYPGYVAGPVRRLN